MCRPRGIPDISRSADAFAFLELRPARLQQSAKSGSLGFKPERLVLIDHGALPLVVWFYTLMLRRHYSLLVGLGLHKFDTHAVRPRKVGDARARRKFVRLYGKFAAFSPDDVTERSEVPGDLEPEVIGAPLIVTDEIVERLQGRALGRLLPGGAGREPGW